MAPTSEVGNLRVPHRPVPELYIIPRPKEKKGNKKLNELKMQNSFQVFFWLSPNHGPLWNVEDRDDARRKERNAERIMKAAVRKSPDAARKLHVLGTHHPVRKRKRGASIFCHLNRRKVMGNKRGGGCP